MVERVISSAQAPLWTKLKGCTMILMSTCSLFCPSLPAGCWVSQSDEDVGEAAVEGVEQENANSHSWGSWISIDSSTLVTSMMTPTKNQLEISPISVFKWSQVSCPVSIHIRRMAGSLLCQDGIKQTGSEMGWFSPAGGLLHNLPAGLPQVHVHGGVSSFQWILSDECWEG